jgi:hypothetical protein
MEIFYEKQIVPADTARARARALALAVCGM